MSNLSFDHVHVISRNPEASAKWFVEKLEGKVTASHEVRGAPQVYIDFGGHKVIVRGQRPGEAAQDKTGLEWGTDHFGFQVAGNVDFRAYCAGLKSKGVKFTVDVTQFNPTTQIAFIEAPDGVIIELLQRK
ncbi:MAG: VOC family protein [Nitrospinota bacterium]